MSSAPERRTVVAVVAGAGDLIGDLRRLLDPATFDVWDAAAVVDDAAVRAEAVVVDVDRLGDLDTTLRSVPTVAAVRRDAPADVARAIEAGCVDVLPVPLEAAEVAARVSAAARLAAARQDLSDRNAELAAWAQRAGHDLRSPLAVISGMAETLEAAWDRLAEPDRAGMLASIRNQAGRALAMVDEGVALAQAEQGGHDDQASGPAAGRGL